MCGLSFSKNFIDNIVHQPELLAGRNMDTDVALIQKFDVAYAFSRIKARRNTVSRAPFSWA